MKLRSLLIAVISIFLGSTSISHAQEFNEGKKSQLVIRLKGNSRDAEMAARAVRGIGRIESRRSHQSDFFVEVRDGLSADEALRLLAKRPEVRAAVVRYDADKVGEENSEKGLKYDRLDALRFWFEQRAFPFGQIDRGAYQRAADHRKTMPAAKFARTTSGIQTLAAPPANWTFLGPKNLGGASGTRPWSGRINGLAYDPTNLNTIYAATSSGGVWKSTDAGVNWTPLSDGWPFMYATSIAITPDGSTIYVGTGDYNADFSINGRSFGSGVMKSTNGGASWTQHGLANGFQNSSISKIVIDPETPTTITIAQGRGQSGFGGIWRSTNSGSTWTKTLNVNDSWSDLAVSAISAGVRYYYTVSDGGFLYRSADRGATWTLQPSPLTPGFNTPRVAAHPTNQQIAYVLDSSGERVMKTGTAGASWIDVTNGLAPGDWGQSWYDAYIGVTVNGANDYVYVGLIDLWQSRDSGASWNKIGNVYSGGTPKLHPDQQTMTFRPGNPNQGLFGTDGGVYSFDFNTGTNTLTTTPLNANLGTIEFYHIAIHPTNPDYVIGGAQDNGTSFSAAGNLNNWVFATGGDGGTNAINPSNVQNQYSSYVFGQIWRTDNEWANVSVIQGQQGGTAWIAPFILDPNNPNLLFSGVNQGVNRYDKTTGTWTTKLGGTDLTNFEILSVAIAPTNSARMYTTASDGQVWMSTNSGSTWTQINTGLASLPTRAITSLSVSPTNADDILVTVSGLGTPHVYRCTNPTAGGSRTWTNVGGVGSPLPDIPFNTIARDPDDPGLTWYAGGDVGVFMTTDAGATWTNASTPLGLPNVQVNHLVVRTSDRMLYAGTWGRGAWRLALPALGTMRTLALSPTTVAGGVSSVGTVTLYTAAPVGGTTVNLSSNNAAAVVPATVTVPQGLLSQTFNITTANTTYGQINATITASFGAETKPKNLTINPANYAQYIGQSVPASMVAGQSYPVTIQFKNVGPVIWNTVNGYKLQSRNPTNNTTFGMNRLPLTNGPIANGQTATYGATVIAPASTGTYNFQWLSIQDSIGANFGPTSTNVAVAVTKLADAARWISRTGPLTIGAGADFYVQNTMMNVGTNTWTGASGYSMRTESPANNTTWTINRSYLPSGGTVAPNANGTFTGLATAPVTPGTYTMQWRMHKSGVAFGDLSPLLSINVVASADNAEYVSSTTVPTSVGPGTNFSVTYTMKNRGTNAWDGTYSLVSTGSNNFGNAGIVSGAVAPNANGTFVGNFIAPAAPGTYTFKWRMKKGATLFGQASPTISIVVSADASQYISRVGPLSVNAGSDFYIQNIMKNTGTTTWTHASGYSMRTESPANNTTWTINRAYMSTGATITPGINGTFTGLCTAPITPGVYTMQWKVHKSGVSFGELSPLLNINVVQGPDNAQFVSQTGVPTTIVRSTTFNATITMKNLGTATWDGTYSLASIGSNTFGISSIVATTTAQNANKAFTATFTAPATPGTYTFKMRMQKGATKFGQTSTQVTITVT